jgi:hypothetical protein
MSGFLSTSMVVREMVQMLVSDSCGSSAVLILLPEERS